MSEWHFRDLVVDQSDGTLSLTKVAAAVAHFMMALVFAKVSFATGFVPEMWMYYGTFALGHAIINKVSAQIKDFKEQRLDAETPPK